MMRPTTPIAALMVVTAVDYVLTMNSVPIVSATWEILVSANVGVKEVNYLKSVVH